MGKTAKVEKLQATLRKDAKRERLWYGPYTLPAVNVRINRHFSDNAIVVLMQGSGTDQ